MGYETYTAEELRRFEADYASHRKSLTWVENTEDRGLTAETARANLREIDRTLKAIRDEIKTR